MAFEQHFSQELKLFPGTAASENSSVHFDCNICLDSAHEPVVTLCGHLYCWPCIYKWVHLQSASSAYKHPQCPVCKAAISYTTIVPLYGRGQSKSELKTEASSKGMEIPPRPAACSNQAPLSTEPQRGQQLPYRNLYLNQRHNLQLYHEENLPPSPLALASVPAMTGVLHPMSSMFGEMVYARVFGNSESFYAYPNSYHLPRGTTPRLRRFYMQADKSLHRISIFLFCCFLLCLIVF